MTEYHKRASPPIEAGESTDTDYMHGMNLEL